jgi:ketosteroid isomerase-like protein
METKFDEAKIRLAERLLEKALESPDPTAWVYAYTEDAIFAGPGAPAVEGRAALLEMASAMRPLSSVSIRALRTEGSGNLACVYGQASWVSGRASEAGPVANVRFIIVWRKEADGQWRVAQELLNADPAYR